MKNQLEKESPSKKSRKTYINILKAHWPVFKNPKKPLPLASETRESILQEIKDKELDISNRSIRRALFLYTSSLEYQSALASGGFRYDLNGKAVGEISSSHQENAKVKAKALIDKRKAWKDSKKERKRR